jgi:hypothetical protein
MCYEFNQVLIHLSIRYHQWMEPVGEGQLHPRSPHSSRA